MSEIDDLQFEGVFRPRDEPSLRWGIAGTGWIAARFADGVNQHTKQVLQAVGSRAQERSDDFARRFGLPRAHSSYGALIEDDDVDVVYVALTADQHSDLALAAIAAGKPVLVEKPFTMTAAEASEIRDAARSAGVFVMEAMWTRYLPQFDALRLLRSRGDLGDILLVSGDHGQALDSDPTSRLMRPEVGGGALLDLGVYPLSFASEILGSPSSISAVGDLTQTGVDGTVGLVLRYAGSSAQAVVSTTIRVKTPTVAAVCGSEARVDLDGDFYTPTGFTVRSPEDGADPLLRWVDRSGISAHEGLSYQATALARFVGEGRLESPLLGLDETVDVMSTIDEARAQVSSAEAARVPAL